MTDSKYAVPSNTASVQRLAAVVGVAGLAICALGFMRSPEQFYRAWLIAFLFWWGVSLGSMAWMMVHHLSGGQWGVVTRRVFEASSRTMPFVALAFVPIAIGAHYLYPWARPDEVAADAILQHRAPYLNASFFYLRAVIYFLIWSGLTFTMTSWSRRQDAAPNDTALALRMQRLSGAGLVIYGVTLFFASVDWLMSIDPHWYSTIYGIIMLGGQGLASMAFTIAVVVLLARTRPLSHVIQAHHLHDLGKLLLTFVMLWAYFQFSQFIIIWSANLPMEITFYLTRIEGAWVYISAVIVLGHFALPFVLLLNRDLKRSGTTLSLVALYIIVMRFVDLFWLMGPRDGHAAPALSWMHFVTPLAVGGIWIAIFLWQLGSRPLLPLGDSGLAEVLEHGGH
jgi:hypothetical protein